MPAVLLEPLESPPRKRWTRAECDALEAFGLLVGERLELIDGELINKAGKNRAHVVRVLLMHEWLVGVFGFLHVQQNASVDVASEDNALNEPEPDLVVLRESRARFFENPRPGDVLLVVEVADNTLSFDLTQKARFYARAGILDYWVLDVNKRRLIVHREPLGGNYASVLVYHESESVAPLAAPKSPFRVAQAFEE